MRICKKKWLFKWWYENVLRGREQFPTLEIAIFSRATITSWTIHHQASASRARWICSQVWSHLCEFVKYVKYVNITSVQVCKYMKYVNFVWSHLCIKLTQGLLFPPLHWLISLYWDQEARAGYIWRIIVKMCKRKIKSHQSSSCEFKLVAIETNWLTKLLLHVVSCHRRALSVIKLRLFNTKNISTLSRYWIKFKYLWITLNCMWVQKVLAIETNWATKCRVIRAHYQWLTLTND